MLVFREEESWLCQGQERTHDLSSHVFSSSGLSIDMLTAENGGENKHVMLVIILIITFRGLSSYLQMVKKSLTMQQMRVAFERAAPALARPLKICIKCTRGQVRSYDKSL